jgi:hypothetical protein
MSLAFTASNAAVVVSAARCASPVLGTIFLKPAAGVLGPGGARTVPSEHRVTILPFWPLTLVCQRLLTVAPLRAVACRVEVLRPPPP